jgi:hypothetical protein
MASHVVLGMKGEIRSLAVIATSGSYAKAGGFLTEIGEAELESLEGRLWPIHSGELAYIGRDYLRRSGVRKSRVLSYDRYLDANWGDMLDGVLVLKSEAPPTYIRPRKPMQSALK